MELKHKFAFVEGSVNLNELEIVSVASKKNAVVGLCIRANFLIPIADIKLYSRDRFVDAEYCFESARALGKEIERRWQLQSELAALQKIADFAFDIHTRDPVNVKNKWGVCGVKAEEKLCDMIEAQLPKE